MSMERFTSTTEWSALSMSRNGFSCLEEQDHVSSAHRIPHPRTIGRSRAPRNMDVNQENLQWLLSLPEKARHHFFSLEEQASLTESSEPFGRSARGIHNDTLALHKSRPPFRKFSSMPPKCLSSELPLRNYTPTQTGLAEINEQTTMDTRTAHKSRLPTKTSSSSTVAGRRRPSLRRAMSLITIPHMQPSTTSSTSPAALLNEKRDKRQADCSPIQESFCSPSEYYRNPETRSKLKRGLSSPQGFDEALEFGFPNRVEPCHAGVSYSQPMPSRLSSPTSSNDMQKFLRDNTLSFIDTSDELQSQSPCLDDDDDFADSDDDSFYLTSPSRSSSRHDDETSMSDMESPKTPQSGHMDTSQPVTVRTGSVGSANTQSPNQTLAPKVMRHFYDGDSETLVRRGGWEKTLRITLTKPELRATEQETYGLRGSDVHAAVAHDHQKARVQDDAGWILKSNESSRVRHLWNRVWQTAGRK